MEDGSLIQEIKKNPLTKNYINNFYGNHLDKIIVDNSLKTFGSIEDKEDPTKTWAYCCSFPFRLIPNQKFIIKLNFKKHIDNLKIRGFTSEGHDTLEEFLGETIIHEMAHPKYHYWAWLDELKGDSCYWHDIVDKEAHRFTIENKKFASSLLEKDEYKPYPLTF